MASAASLSLTLDISLSLQELYTKILIRAGHSVTKADNGSQVLQIIEEQEKDFFDLFVLDNRMPELTGLEFLEGQIIFSQ